LDDFLDPEFARRLYEEFPSVDAMPKSRDYMFGNKHELSSVEANGPVSAAFYEHIMSEEFRLFLVEIAGADVFVDPAFFGGGFHQGGDGSYLDMHVDFNMHPLHQNWLRTLNILLYLNPEWKSEYGGELLIRARPEDEPVAIAPVFNRAIIMLTDRHTFHGYKKMSLPPGVTRKSIASYAYQVVAADSNLQSHTTGWVPEDGGLGKRLIARHYDTLVRVKNRYFGSRTARNR
jgi:Rps23 Pro-64 3,4-dihydroxylase Tpa1-like proline 4-hydroxylase